VEQQRLKLELASARVAVQRERVSNPRGHLHTCVQRLFRRLPFPLPLGKSISSPSAPPRAGVGSCHKEPQAGMHNCLRRSILRKKMLEISKLLHQAWCFGNFLILIRQCGRPSETLQRQGAGL